MARPDFIREQLSATKALIRFLDDHRGGIDDDLQACLRALEREDIDTAVRHARLIKPWGMDSLTDWCPSVVQPLETREHNAVVLHALVSHWCSRISLSFDELGRTQRDLQVCELDARMNSKGYVLCPFCHKTFSSASSTSWDGARHATCGVRFGFDFSYDKKLNIVFNHAAAPESLTFRVGCSHDIDAMSNTEHSDWRGAWAILWRSIVFIPYLFTVFVCVGGVWICRWFLLVLLLFYFYLHEWMLAATVLAIWILAMWAYHRFQLQRFFETPRSLL